MDLALLPGSARDVGEGHVVRKRVDDATLLWRQCRGEDERLAREIIPEEQELRVKLERLRVVEVDVYI